MEGMSPLTIEKGCIDLVNCVKKRLYFEDDVLSALALAKKKFPEIKHNRLTNNLNDKLLIVWKSEIDKVLDDCFPIQDEGKE